MTTIVYRDGVMAADTGIFDRGCYCGERVKIFGTPDGRLGGLAGCAGDSVAFRDWFAAGAEGDPPEFKDDQSEGLIVYPAGRVEQVLQGRKRFEIIGPFHALGSGFRIALGALYAGATAKRAVEIAAAIDDGTRGPFTILTHVEAEVFRRTKGLVRV